MDKRSFSDIVKLCEELLKQERFDEVMGLIEQVKPGYEDKTEWASVAGILERIPTHTRAGIAAILYAKALRFSGKYQELIEWNDYVHNDQTLVGLECAAGLNTLQQYAGARDLLKRIIPKLTGEDLGIAWARLGFALFHLKESWEDCYREALLLLRGEERGRALLNFGYALSMSGRDSEANEVWLEALAYFKKNPYLLAWLRYNLATIGLNNLEPQAERHLLAALREAQHPKAHHWKPYVWIGLGRFRGWLGEWKRAEFAFRQALGLAKDTYSEQTAHRGLIRTYYWSGQLDEALEHVESALQEPGIAHALLHVVQAKVYLKLGKTAKAKAALEKAGLPQFELEEWSWRIASAELARQEGHLDQAVVLLEDLPLQNIDARADVQQFPLLFALLEASGRAIPRPLEYVQGTTVRVQAQGVLQVSVNGRLVELTPTGRVGELLVFLLEQGGAASLEVIGDALYPDLTQAPKRRKAVWKLVNGLRQALGWEDSVLALRGAYQLDPQATWLYDVAEARAKGEFRGEFLAGVYSEWALEVGRELQDLAPQAHSHNLN